MLVACAPDRSTSPAGRLGAITRSSDVAPTEQLLYNQPPVQFTSVFTGGAILDAVAMDFVVPPGGNWRVRRVVVVGQGFNPTSGAGLFQINVFKDEGGQPGDIVISSIGTVPDGIPNPCCAGDVFDYNRSLFIELAPGRYWITNRLSGGSTRTFNPQFAPRVGYPALLGQPFPPTWSPILADAPNNDFAFSVYGTVETAAEVATNLLTTMEGFALPAGMFTSLQAKVNAALAALDGGDTNTACNAFQDLINAASAQSGKKLTEAQAQTIIDAATKIRAIIGC
jgi:hypothetical protein